MKKIPAIWFVFAGMLMMSVVVIAFKSEPPDPMSAYDICVSGDLVPTGQPIIAPPPDFKNVSKRETIELSFDIDRAGNVISSSIVILETSDARFNEDAIATISQWKYCPLSAERPQGQRAERKARFHFSNR